MSKTKTVYKFSPLTREYLRTDVEDVAEESPLEPGVFLKPANSTYKKPPVTKANEAAVIDEAKDSWSVVPDFRGQTFYDQASGSAVVIDALGAVPVNLGATIPASIVAQQAADALRKAKNDQAMTINAACASAIVAGFDSNALGSSFHYAYTLADQANLMGKLLLGVGGDLTCVDSAGVKARRPHSLDELKVVVQNGEALKDQCLAKARMLKDSIAEAAGISAVLAVVWS